MSFANILRVPDAVWVQGPTEWAALDARPEETWEGGGCAVRTRVESDCIGVALAAPGEGVQRLRLRWRVPAPGRLAVLGDHWERGYGDLEWRGIVPERTLPWYFLAHDGERTHACGVRTGARALCCWRLDASGIELWLDVRCGGAPVLLGDRTLDAATVICREGDAGESPFEAARSLCRAMCPAGSRTPSDPVYGTNDWYYAYGQNSRDSVLKDAETLAALAPDGLNRPYAVLDAGWGICGNLGPWRGGHRGFPEMGTLAADVAAFGVRPGIWIRPLRTLAKLPKSWYLPTDRFWTKYAGAVLDPTVPEAIEHIASDFRLLADWGFELIKHDFTTYDLLGRWGFEMGDDVTPSGWHFSDRGRTTAEVVLDLYRAIRDAACDAVLLGCNTIGHLAAGLVELQRVGDDTSGREWERTRKMGINTLAFRGVQHGAFFAADADCVGLTRDVPWRMNRQWLDLLARSGTPLFVSVAPEALGPEQRVALKDAFALAASEQPVAEPLDWTETTCPGRWRLGGEAISYDWFCGGAPSVGCR